MNQKQIAAVAEHYHEMFWDDLSQEVIDLLPDIDDEHDLEMYREDISAGAFDAIEAVLLGL